MPNSLPARLLIKSIIGAMRLFFYLLYQPFAWTYDWVASIVSAGRWNSWVLSVLPDLAGPRILELGHGPGHLQLALHQKNLYPLGLDRSRQMSRLAARRLRRAGCWPALVRGEAQKLPYPSVWFDQVVCTFPTEYVLAHDTISEVRRILQDNGLWIILPGAWITGDSVRDKLSAFLFRITGQAPPLEDDSWLNPYLEPFRQAGFRVVIERRETRSSRVLILLAYRDVLK